VTSPLAECIRSQSTLQCRVSTVFSVCLDAVTLPCDPLVQLLLLIIIIIRHTTGLAWRKPKLQGQVTKEMTVGIDVSSSGHCHTVLLLILTVVSLACVSGDHHSARSPAVVWKKNVRWPLVQELVYSHAGRPVSWPQHWRTVTSHVDFWACTTH